MASHTLFYNVFDKRMPRIKECALHIQLNGPLNAQLSNLKSKEIFTHKSSTTLLETTLLKLGRQGHLNEKGSRVPNDICKELLETMRDYSCLKTLADQLSLDTFFNITLLVRTSYSEPRLNLFVSFHA